MSKLLPLVFKLHFIPFHVLRSNDPSFFPQETPRFITSHVNSWKRKQRKFLLYLIPLVHFSARQKAARKIFPDRALFKWTYSGFREFSGQYLNSRKARNDFRRTSVSLCIPVCKWRHVRLVHDILTQVILDFILRPRLTLFCLA